MAQENELQLSTKAVEKTKVLKSPEGSEGMVKVIDRKLNSEGDAFIESEKWISQYLAETQMALPKEQRMPAFRTFTLA